MSSFIINKSGIVNNLQTLNFFKLPHISTTFMPNPPSTRLLCYDTVTKSILFSTEEFKWKVLLQAQLPVV